MFLFNAMFAFRMEGLELGTSCWGGVFLLNMFYLLPFTTRITAHFKRFPKESLVNLKDNVTTKKGSSIKFQRHPTTHVS